MARTRILAFLPLGLSPAAAALAALGCAASSATVAKNTANLTGCQPANLAVFNYDKKAGSWDAACGEQIFACTTVHGKRQCTQLEASGVNPELAARVQVLQQVPQSRRKYFASTVLLATPWPDFARNVAVVSRLNDAQLKAVDDPRTVYTGFSPALDAQLTQCVGPNKVARISVSKSGEITPATGAASCVRAIAMQQELSPLSKYPSTTIILAPGVRDLTLPNHPGETAAAEPAADAEAKRLADEAAKAKADQELAESNLAAVRTWLDGLQLDLTKCTGVKEIPVDVVVDASGVPTVTLQGKLNTPHKKSCVQTAVGDKHFEGGARTLSYVVGAPHDAPASAASEPSAAAAPARAEAAPASSAAAPAPAPAPAAPAAAGAASK
jgi:hypothetical protein